MRAPVLCMINMSPSTLQENANRLKAYKTNLVVFPRRSKKPKAGDSPAEQLQTVSTPIFTNLPRLHARMFCPLLTEGGRGPSHKHWQPSCTELEGSRGLGASLYASAKLSGLMAQWRLHPQPALAQPDCSWSQVAQHTGVLLPAKRAAPEVETVAITDEMKVPLMWRRCSVTTHHLSRLSGICHPRRALLA
jgi:Ribosomal protein L13e